MPLITFVCPNRNKAVFLPEALQSLCGQTLKDIEIIVVDDDSTDDSRDIINVFKKKDKRVKGIFLKPASGYMDVGERIDRARNIGNKEAKSKYICVADSDDIYLPERAKISYENIREEKEPTLFYGAFLLRNRYGEIESGISPIQSSVDFSERRFRETRLFFIGHITVCYPKETILNYPYNSQTGVGDWGMFYNLIFNAKVKLKRTPEPLTIYRIYGNSYKQLRESGKGDYTFQEYLRKKKDKKIRLMNEPKTV